MRSYGVKGVRTSPYQIKAYQSGHTDIQGRVQFSIVEAGPRDTGLYELHTILKGEEHRAAFAINVL